MRSPCLAPGGDLLARHRFTTSGPRHEHVFGSLTAKQNGPPGGIQPQLPAQGPRSRRFAARRPSMLRWNTP
jgi:hypothetical protein